MFGFTSRSFEQFTQAAAVHILGPGITVFGSGPDGGREATFDGRVPYPFATDTWHGFGVLQAKYKEKSEGTQKDQDWAIRMLRQELDEFVSSTKRKRNRNTLSSQQTLYSHPPPMPAARTLPRIS